MNNNQACYHSRVIMIPYVVLGKNMLFILEEKLKQSQ